MTEVVQLKNFGSPLSAVDIGRVDRFDWVRLKEDLGNELGHVYSQDSQDGSVRGVAYWLGPVMFAACAVIGLIFTVVVFS